MTERELIYELEKMLKVPPLTQKEFKQAKVIKEAISKLEELEEAKP